MNLYCFKHRFSVLTVLLLSLCCVAPSVESFAAESALSEQYFLQEFPVVLSASRLSQPLAEAPNSMTVIDRDMIKASGFRTIVDLFRLVPGMYVSYNTGNEPFVAYHGSTDNFSRRMQVLVDGRSIFMPPIGAVTWVNLPLLMEDIERIEVIRGPAAASHGGNSTQGVINIITREAGASPGFKASITQGDGGISDASVNIGSRGETLDYRLSMVNKSDDGYDAVPTKINNDSQHTKIFNLRSNYHPNAVDSFDIQLGFSDGSKAVGNKATDALIPHDLQNSEGFTQLVWLRSLNATDELKVQYYHIDQHEFNAVPPNTLSGYPALEDSYTNTRDDLEIQHTLQTSPSNRLVWGGSLRNEWTRANSRFLAEQKLQQSTFFAHDEWRMTPSWLVNAGAMQEDSGLGQNNLSPRFALIYKINDKHTLRTGWSQAYRNPSVYEERGNYHFPGYATLYVAKGGLRPESVLSREIAYIGEFPGYGVSLDTRIYHDEVKDVIYETDVYPKNFVNLFDATHDGFELTSKHNWGDRNRLTFNYSYQELNSDFNFVYANPYSGTMPRHMISALYSKTFPRDIALSIGYYQQDTMLPIDRWQSDPANTNIDRQPFTTRWDMRIAKTFNSSKTQNEGEIAFVVQNLFNEHSFDYQNENIVKQRAFVTTSVKF